MIKDMANQRFGKLLVLEKAGTRGTAQHVVWKCQCDCGNVAFVVGAYIRKGRVRSCGCGSAETHFSAERLTTHGMSKTRTYKIWRGMVQRTSKQSNKKSHLYFDKGITVCDRWKTFENFLADMGEAPDGFSIDRKDGNKGYFPENCRWATATEQANNTSANVNLTYAGVTQSISMWARQFGIKPNTLLYRIRRGWSVQRAITGVE